MIAVDTNVLIYASRPDVKRHAEAFKALRAIAEGDTSWGLPWPCVYEFVRVVTDPRVFDPPTPLEDALEFIERLLDSPTAVPLGEGLGHRTHMRRCLTQGQTTGNIVHDAHIAALLVEHGVSEFLTADRDFSRFPAVQVRLL